MPAQTGASKLFRSRLGLYFQIGSEPRIIATKPSTRLATTPIGFLSTEKMNVPASAAPSGAATSRYPRCQSISASLSRFVLVDRAADFATEFALGIDLDLTR